MNLKTLFATGCLALLLACSGGAGSKTSAEAPTGLGSIVLTIHASENPAQAGNGINIPGYNPPPATDIRFIVNNASTGFNSIQDVVIAGTASVNIPVPAANGYTLAAISSSAGFNYVHYMLKFAEVTGINIVANTNTHVAMALQPMSASITTPTSVSEGDPFSITITAPRPLQLFGYMNTSTTPFEGITVGYNNPPTFNSGTLTLNALTPRDANGTAIAGTMYFQAVYFINPAFTTGGNEWQQWAYVYPSPFQGDSPVTCHLTVPTGGLGVDVTY